MIPKGILFHLDYRDMGTEDIIEAVTYLNSYDLVPTYAQCSLATLSNLPDSVRRTKTVLGVDVEINEDMSDEMFWISASDIYGGMSGVYNDR